MNCDPYKHARLVRQYIILTTEMTLDHMIDFHENYLLGHKNIDLFLAQKVKKRKLTREAAKNK